MQGSLSDVFDSLAGAKNLKNLNLYRDSGLGGNLVPSTPGLTLPSLCSLARNSLTTFNLEGASAQGYIPACLLGAGSKLIELHLGMFSCSLTIARLTWLTKHLPNKKRMGHSLADVPM